MATFPRIGRRRGVILGVIAGLGLLMAGTALAGTPAADQARSEPLVPGTPCTVSAKACVDLDSQRSWLFQDGKILKGPVPVATGAQGMETPVGHSLRVYRKDANFASTEYPLPNGKPAPMPWSTFIEDGGIAFHAGDPKHASAGCVHLSPDDAKAWFDYLQIGDKVQVVSAKEEAAARGGH